MEGKGGFFILLVIIAILTLTLAVAMGYLLIVGGNPQAKTEVPVAAEAQKTTRPLEKDLAQIQLFTENNFFNLKTADTTKVPILVVNAELTYFKTIKGYKGKTDEKINFNLAKIKEIVGTYFQKQTMADVQQLDAKEKASRELCKEINEYLSSNEKQKYEFVYEIAFDKWFYQ